MRARPLWFCLAAILSGCSSASAPPSTKAGAPPVEFRATTAQAVRSAFFDPYSVRDAAISQPLYASAVFDGITPIPRSGWIVCVRANAKNRFGAYIGQQLTVLLFRGDAVELTLSGPEYAGQLVDLCRPAVFQPFTEIEGA